MYQYCFFCPSSLFILFNQRKLVGTFQTIYITIFNQVIEATKEVGKIYEILKKIHKEKMNQENPPNYMETLQKVLKLENIDEY